MRQIKTTIYMKTGQELTVFLDEISVKKVPSIGGLITELTWKNASVNLPGILRLDIDEIVAIVTEEVEMKLAE